ncbi:MAG: ParB/RepB/Spo0J family partition protein [Acidobacteriota bacterium]|nr:MAG: ParB/RepB/Spo0J family partition protein [Acidobacteriota bacterium]
MKRKALGKGLDALLPENRESGALIHIDIDQIQPNPLQPRVHFQSEKLDELAASLKENGILQPLVVRPAEIGYEIIAGERRWRAAQRAEIQSLPAIVQDVSDREMLELALIENIQRDDLNAIEEAQAYKLMIEQFGLTQEEVSHRVARSRSAVTNTLRLLQLPPFIQELVINDRLTMGHARALLPLSETQQRALAKQILARDLSVRDTERRVQALLKQKDETQQAKKLDPNIRAAERRLEEFWQTKIEIRQKGRRGQIILHYSSQEELDRLYEGLLSD